VRTHACVIHVCPKIPVIVDQLCARKYLESLTNCAPRLFQTGALIRRVFLKNSNTHIVTHTQHTHNIHTTYTQHTHNTHTHAHNRGHIGPQGYELGAQRVRLDVGPRAQVSTARYVPSLFCAPAVLDSSGVGDQGIPARGGHRLLRGPVLHGSPPPSHAANGLQLRFLLQQDAHGTGGDRLRLRRRVWCALSAHGQGALCRQRRFAQQDGLGQFPGIERLRLERQQVQGEEEVQILASRLQEKTEKGESNSTSSGYAHDSWRTETSSLSIAMRDNRVPARTNFVFASTLSPVRCFCY
jgi:hypothetical protein